MKKVSGFLSFLSVFLFLISSCSQPKTCQSFRNGDFKLIDNENGISYKIHRQDSIQTEYEVQTGIKMVFKVNWISDCQYTLKYFKGKGESKEFFKGKLITVNIIDTFDDGYSYSMKVSGKNQIRYGIMKKVYE